MSQIKAEAADGFQTFIIRYREDPDQQNFIDWVQEEWVSKAIIRIEKIMEFFS